MIALINKNSENIIKFFINKKTDLNKKNINGHCPLMIALKFENPENIIKL